MDNLDYVYKETEEEKKMTPEYKVPKLNRFFMFVNNNRKKVAMIAVVLFIAYTMLLGGGRFLGTWKAVDGRYTYKYTFMPCGFGDIIVYNGEKVVEKVAIHWEYDDTTKCILITWVGEGGSRAILYKVLGVDGDTLIVSGDGSKEETAIFYKE